MAKFKYVGDPNDNFSGPDIASAAGMTFVKGEVTEVSDKDSVKQLKGNSHFVDMSDTEQMKDVAERQKVLEKLEADKAKAEEDQRKRDEADRKEMLDNQAKDVKRRGRPPGTAAAPRPPGTVTREPVTDPFNGRPVEARTQAEDHTKAGKTKG